MQTQAAARGRPAPPVLLRPTPLAARLPGPLRSLSRAPLAAFYKAPLAAVYEAPLAAVLLALLCAVPAPATAAGGEDAARPGAYCPLPEPGQRPVCLAPAQAKYGDFFEAVETGRVEADDVAAVEADLSAPGDAADAYLALSSLSYGYWRLAERMSAAPDADPALHARLARWNGLLVRLYEESGADPAFREAVREAATDLDRRTPATAPPCPNRYPGGCRHSDDLVRALAAIDDSAGVRSPLGRLIERIVGDDPSRDD